MAPHFWLKALIVSLVFLSQTPFLQGETVKLSSGREVRMIDGRLPDSVAEELFREAEGLLKDGRLDLAGESWQVIVDKAKGATVSRARAGLEELRSIEYRSYILLGSGKVLRGKIKAHLRADLLGMEGKEEIPLWNVEEIVAEYHPGYSFVSKTFYPMTLLEIKLRNRELQTTKIAGEVAFVVEGLSRSETKAILGKTYELLRPEDLDKQLEKMTADRIIKVVIYPDLRRLR